VQSLRTYLITELCDLLDARNNSSRGVADFAKRAAIPAHLDSLQGKGLLQAAVRNDRPAALRQLLDMGLDPDERTQIGQHEDQTFSAGGRLLEAVNTGRIDLARVLLDQGADPNAQVFTAGSPTAAAYSGGSLRLHEPDPAMIDLMVQHCGWIDAASVGYLRNADLARRMLEGKLDPHLESGTFSGQTAEEQILWSGASGRSADIVRMALERIDWPRDDLRWFWMLWRPLPGYQDLSDAEQADCRASFRLILERCDPNLRAGESGQTMLHEVIARHQPHPAAWTPETRPLHGAHGRPGRLPEEYAPRGGRVAGAVLSWSHCCWLEGPIRSRPGPSRGPHRSRGPNGVNMRGLHRFSGNTDLTDSCSQSLTTLRVLRLFFSTPSTAYIRARRRLLSSYSRR
jgi:hypothetical protein